MVLRAFCLGLFLIGATPVFLQAHSGERHPGSPAVTVEDSAGSDAGTLAEPLGLYWDMWFDFQLISILGTAVLLYLLGVGPMRPRLAPGRPFPTRKAVLFISGVVLYYVSVSSSLDEIGEVYLFTAHMLQHNIIIYIIPLLLLLGMPTWLVDGIVTSNIAKRWLGAFVSPLSAFVLFNLCFVIWHVPALYEWALRDKLVHDLEHTTFLLTAILMWWPVFAPSKTSLPPLRHYGLQMLYIFALAVAQLPLFAYLCFADQPHYPTYVAAPRIVDMAPLDDQFVGGVLMKVFAMFAYVGVWAHIFFRWSRESGSGDVEPVATPIQSAA